MQASARGTIRVRGGPLNAAYEAYKPEQRAREAEGLWQL